MDVPRWVPRVAIAGAFGVVAYVSSWALAGALHEDYDPIQQAISELFARGAPSPGSWLLAGSLVVTGVLLVAFGFALHVGLPGRGLAGPIAASLSGVMTILVVAFPCTDGCPGFGTSFTDTMHVIVAGTGYAALVIAPLLFARRLRGHDDRLARISLLLGGLAAVGFLLRTVGFAPELTGLQQRVFNTLADLWYVVAAFEIVRRTRRTA